jgi:hypothetical protein
MMLLAVAVSLKLVLIFLLNQAASAAVSDLGGCPICCEHDLRLTI